MQMSSVSPPYPRVSNLLGFQGADSTNLEWKILHDLGLVESVDLEPVDRIGRTDWSVQGFWYPLASWNLAPQKRIGRDDCAYFCETRTTQ